jgi:hypothetical protein
VEQFAIYDTDALERGASALPPLLVGDTREWIGPPITAQFFDPGDYWPTTRGETLVSARVQRAYDMPPPSPEGSRGSVGQDGANAWVGPPEPVLVQDRDAWVGPPEPVFVQDSDAWVGPPEQLLFVGTAFQMLGPPVEVFPIL